MMDPNVAQRGLGSIYDATIALAAASNNIPVSLIKGIISVESAWDPNAVNLGDPSYGLMQVNTRAHPDVTPAQMLDPTQNINYGSAYLGSQVARYGLSGGVSSYNAGHPISGNQSYVNDVLAYKAWFDANDPASAGGIGGTVTSLLGMLSPADTTFSDGTVALDTSSLDSTGLLMGGGLALLIILAGLALYMTR